MLLSFSSIKNFIQKFSNLKIATNLNGKMLQYLAVLVQFNLNSNKNHRNFIPVAHSKPPFALSRSRGFATRKSGEKASFVQLQKVSYEVDFILRCFFSTPTHSDDAR